MKATIGYIKGLGIRKKGATAIVAGSLVLGVGATTVLTTLPAQAGSEQVRSERAHRAHADNPLANLEKETENLNGLVKTFLSGANVAPKDDVQISKKKLTTLIADQIASKDPSLSPELVKKSAAAIGDLAGIAVKLDTRQLAQLGEGGALLAAAIADIAASSAANLPPRLESIANAVKGGGMVGAATLTLLISALHMYEASPNLPQVADVLDLLDPASKDGAKIFRALPKELRTAEFKSVLHTFAEFGRTLNSVDKYELLDLGRKIALLLAGQNPTVGESAKSEK
ncbi:hypothetical protein [Streptomyces sp. NPDC005438]|uniref:hypothetical protein n=1 Tax=Streptomyces sp. NPDC005438 TaxID=3156880 RepID=UPI0033AE99CA